MKALIELPCFIENVLWSTLSYPNETSKECIQFLIIFTYGMIKFDECNTCTFFIEDKLEAKQEAPVSTADFSL